MSMDEYIDDPLSCTVSLSMKVNLGNFENVDCFVSVSNITQDTTPEEVSRLIEGPAEEAYGILRQAMLERVASLRAKSTPQALGSTISPKPSPRPKAVPKRHPEGKMGALKAQEQAVLEQLVGARLVESGVLGNTVLKQALRVRLTGPEGSEAPMTEESMYQWVTALTKFRDDNIPGQTEAQKAAQEVPF